MNPYLEKIYNQITIDLSTHLFKMLKDYQGHELEIVRLMTAQLGSLIAVSSKDPKQALAYYATRLAHFNWEEVRSDYFANTLGVDTTISTNKPLCEVRRIDPGNVLRTGNERPSANGSERTEHTGDPALKKPD